MPSMQLSWSTPNLRIKTSSIWLDNKEVKQTISSLEEELEGMFTEYKYMDKPIKIQQRNILELYWKLWIHQHVFIFTPLHSQNQKWIYWNPHRTQTIVYSNYLSLYLHSSDNQNLFPQTKDWFTTYSYHQLGWILWPNVPYFRYVPKFHWSETSSLALKPRAQIFWLDVPTPMSNHQVDQKTKNTSTKITWRSQFITRTKSHIMTRNY